MSKIALSGNPSGTGTFTIASPNSNTDRTVNLPDAGGDMVLTTATQTLTNKTIQSSTIQSSTIQSSTIQGGALTLATAVTASGTSVDFTSIPSWVKRITVMFNGVSTNGTSNIQIQLGDSGGFENSGYTGAVSIVSTTVNSLTLSVGFLLTQQNASTYVYSGLMTITNISANTWVENSTVGSSSTALTQFGGGTKTLSDILTQVRITTVNGTDTFDAGTINIIYEG